MIFFSRKNRPFELGPYPLERLKHDAKILVAGDNFGCGSSREHAVWALDDYGFSVIISSSFADIFFSNCFKNGILPISLESKMVEKLLRNTNSIEVDLVNLMYSLIFSYCV